MFDITSFIGHFNEFITKALGGNQVAAAAIIAVISSGLLYGLRAVPALVFGFIKQQSTTSMRVTNTGYYGKVLFAYVTEYIHANTDKRLSRQYVGERVYRPDMGEYVIYVAVGLGWHRFRFEDRWLYARRSEYPNNHGEEIKEFIDVYAFGRSSTVLERFLKACEPEDAVKTPRCFEYSCTDHAWVSVGKLVGTGLNACALDTPIREFFVNEFNKFRSSRDAMLAAGIPHKLTMLLHGSPGSGKTSLIRALGTEFHYDVYSLNLGGLFSPTELVKAFSTVPKRSILLLEEIDTSHWASARASVGEKTVMPGKKPEADASSHEKDYMRAGGGLGTLLNLLDGVVVLDELIIMCTTNCADVLDKALVRAGRIDFVVNLPAPSMSAVRDHFQYVWPELVDMPDVRYSALPGCVIYKIKRQALGDAVAAAKAITYYADNPQVALDEQNGVLENINAAQQLMATHQESTTEKGTARVVEST